MSDQTQPLPGSYREAPKDMRAAGRVAADEPVTVSLYLKPADEAPVHALKPAGEAPVHADRASMLAARSTEHGDDITAVSDFASSHGLTIVGSDAARRLVRLTGPASAMEQAFGTELSHYEGGGQTCRARHGTLQVPAKLVDRILAVLGLDTRPIATPKIVPHRGPVLPAGFLPTDVAKLYGFADADASGQCIGLIELGGGYTDADNQAAFKAMGRAVPAIVAVGVDGASNDPGYASDSDRIVGLM